MKRKKGTFARRGLSLFLALLLTFTTVGSTVFAETTAENEAETVIEEIIDEAAQDETETDETDEAAQDETETDVIDEAVQDEAETDVIDEAVQDETETDETGEDAQGGTETDEAGEAAQDETEIIVYEETTEEVTEEATEEATVTDNESFQTLNIDEVQGELVLGESTTAVIETGGASATFSFTAEISGTYRIYSIDENWYGSGTQLYVYDAEGNQLAYDTNGTDYHNAEVVIELTAGETYYFVFSYEDDLTDITDDFIVGIEMPVVSGSCGAGDDDDITWALTYTGDETYLLTISGTGAMADYESDEDQPWYIYDDYITRVVIEDGVTRIGSAAFYYMAAMTEITIPDSVVSIGDYAFYYCRTLSVFSISETCEVGTGSFTGCYELYEDGLLIVNSVLYAASGLSDLVIPDGVTRIDDYACHWSSKIETLTIPDSVSEIGNCAFQACQALETVTIAGTCVIGDAAFNSCTSLTTIDIPESCEIADGAFYNCPSLADEDGFAFVNTTLVGYFGDEEDVVIPDGTTKIDDQAFRLYDDEYSMITVTIPDSVTYVGRAFISCENLQIVIFEGDAPEFAEYSRIMYYYYEGDWGSYGPRYTGVFSNDVKVYYPAGNETWTDSILEADYGTYGYAIVTWCSYESGTQPWLSELAVSAAFVPVQTPQLYQGINSYSATDSDDETFDYYEVSDISFTSGDQIIITMKDESTVIYTCDGSSFCDEDGSTLYFPDLEAETSQYTVHWEVGGTYNILVTLGGFGNITVTVPVTIAENPYNGAEVEYISSVGLTYTQGIDSYTETDEDGESFDYYEYSVYDFTKGDQIVITLKNGTVLTYTFNGSRFYDEDDNRLYFSFSDDQYTSHWTVGGDNKLTLELYDFGLTVEVPVTIVENPYAGATADLVLTNAIELREGIDSYTVAGEYYDEESDSYEEETFQYYSFSRYMFTSGDRIIITLSDESTITYTYDGYWFYDEDGNYLSYSSSASPSQYSTHWEVGGSYAYILTLSDYALTVEVPVTIVENPYISEMTEISAGDVKTAVIEEAGGYVYYSFTPPESGYYQFYTTGDYDTYSELYDADWNLLASDDDSGSGTNTLIEYEMEAGVTYYLGYRFLESSETGSFYVYAKEYDPAVSAQVVLTQTLTVINGIDSWTAYDEDDEAFEYYEFSGFNTGDQIILTLESGSTVTYTYNGTGFYDEEGNYLSYYSSTSQDTEHWEIGGTYSVTFTFYENEYVTAEVQVTVIENPYADAVVSFVPVTAYVMTEGTDSYEYCDDDDELFNYYSFYKLPFTVGDQIVITSSDGSTITYTYNGDWFYSEDGKELSCNWSSSPSQWSTHWTAGNTYEFILTLEDYALTVSIPVTIVEADTADTADTAETGISSASVSVPDQTYTGSALTPAVTVTLGGTVLTKGTDYTVGYSNNTNAGTATVTVTGIGSYTGTVKQTFTINARSLSASTVTLSGTSYTYDGSAKKPSVKSVVLSGTTLSGSDYSVSYANNSTIGTATVTVTGKGNYTGTAAATFTINPGTVKISSVKSSAAKKLTVKWSKLSGSVTGYQVRYKKSSSGSWTTVTVKASTLSRTISSLTAGKKYSVQVRAYKTVSGTSYYGSWSSTKSVTVKKAQTLTVKYSSSRTVKYAKVKSAKQTVTAITKVNGAKGTVTYSKVSGSGKLTINSKTGKITVKKGTKKGTYKIKVKVTSAAKGSYAAASKTVTITVKVK